MISGAMYSGVPQKVVVTAPSDMPSLHMPKSAIFTCPSAASITLSNFRSRYLAQNFEPKTKKKKWEREKERTRES